VSDEQQVAGLREEIRRAGSATRNLRCGTIGCFVAPAALVSVLVLLLFMSGTAYLISPPANPEEPTAANYLRDVISFLGGAVLVGLAVGLPLALGYRWRRRAELRKTLTSLTRDERARVLMPLVNGPSGDTRTLARTLARDLALAREVSPASAGDARGDEASAAEPRRVNGGIEC
jgi:hypothetical protein